MTKIQAGAAALLLAGAAVTLLLQHQSNAELRSLNDGLQTELASIRADNETLFNRVARQNRPPMPRLPAPAIQPGTTTSSEPDPGVRSVTDLYQWLKDKPLKLSLEQLDSYLKANGRNAGSLLAAYRTSGDASLLEEARQKFPNDPQVAFEEAFRKDASADDHRQALDAFKKSDPDNALADYVSALDYFKSGQMDKAVQDLIAASGKSFEDYTSDRYQDDSEAYAASGYSAAEAQMAAGMQLQLPQLIQIRDVSKDMVDLASSYRQEGDNTSAQAALQMAAQLGQRYINSNPGEPEISELVGIAVERNALSAMDPNSAYGDSGQTVQERLTQLKQQRDELQAIAAQVEPIFPQMPDQDWINYRSRWMTFGEASAAQWLIRKYGK